MNSHRIHWLHVLYLYSDATSAKHSTDSSNALVFKENNYLILEIICQIEYGTPIIASFHNISLEDIISVTENNNADFTTSTLNKFLN